MPPGTIRDMSTLSLSCPPKLARHLAALAFLAAFGAAVWRLPQVPEVRFAPATNAPTPAGAAWMQVDMLPGVGKFAASPSLTLLADGRVAASWLSATEGSLAQEAIWFSTLEAGSWQPPYTLTTRDETAGSVFAHIRQIGAPLLWRNGEWLHLWYTATAIGGHAGQTILHTRSADDGASWTRPARVAAAPFGNAGMLLGGPPVALADGGIGLAVGRDLFSQHGEWLHLDADGRILAKARIPHAGAAAAPTAVAIDAGRALAWLGDSTAGTDNGGENWQTLTQSSPANPETPRAVLRLPDGRLLLAGNAGSGRGSLALWLADREGRDWRLVRIVDQAADAAADFSEPALLLAADGGIHLAYAWRRQGIRHLRFNAAWLEASQP